MPGSLNIPRQSALRDAVATWLGLSTLMNPMQLENVRGYDTNKEKAMKCILSVPPCPVQCAEKGNRCFPPLNPNPNTKQKTRHAVLLNNTRNGYLYESLLLLPLDRSIPKGLRMTVMYSAELSEMVVIFPTGFVNQREFEFERVRRMWTALRLLLLRKPVSKLILCGHSEGCVLAQMMAFYMYLLLDDVVMRSYLSRTFVVGSGAYMWAMLDEAGLIKIAFARRLKFFKEPADPYLFMKSDQDKKLVAIGDRTLPSHKSMSIDKHDFRGSYEPLIHEYLWKEEMRRPLSKG